MTLRAQSGSRRMLWSDRVRAASDAWDEWFLTPDRLRMDRVLKAAGVRDLIVERDTLGAEVERLRGVVAMQTVALDACVDRIEHGPLAGNADWWQKAEAARTAAATGGEQHG